MKRLIVLASQVEKLSWMLEYMESAQSDGYGGTCTIEGAEAAYVRQRQG